jgi:hypothetical protein
MHVRITVASPLRECLLHGGFDCAREFCDADAVSADAELIAGWARRAGPEAVGLALRQLNELSEVVGRPVPEGSVLGPAREKLLGVLGAFQSALAPAADPRAAQAQER